MLRFAFAAVAAALVAGCSTINPETPPGASAAINCPSGQLEFCYARAREVCPNGYEVVQLRRNQDLMMVVAPDRLVVKCQGQ